MAETTPRLSVSMSSAMYEETQCLAQNCRITHAEWIRRCIYWGLRNPQHVLELDYPEPYKLPPPGRPVESA